MLGPGVAPWWGGPMDPPQAAPSEARRITIEEKTERAARRGEDCTWSLPASTLVPRWWLAARKRLSPAIAVPGKVPAHCEKGVQEPLGEQSSPEQHGIVGLHTWSAEAHDDFAVQTPWSQVSVALQQGTVVEQVWLVDAHAEEEAV